MKRQEIDTSLYSNKSKKKGNKGKIFFFLFLAIITIGIVGQAVNDYIFLNEYEVEYKISEDCVVISSWSETTSSTRYDASLKRSVTTRETKSYFLTNSSRHKKTMDYSYELPIGTKIIYSYDVRYYFNTGNYAIVYTGMIVVLSS